MRVWLAELICCLRVDVIDAQDECIHSLIGVYTD